MSRVPRLLAPLVVAAALSTSCKREVPPAGEDARAPTAPQSVAETSPERALPASSPAASAAPGAVADGEPAAGQSHYDEPKFAIVAQPSGAYQAGQEGAIDIVLDAKPPFHVNQQYPYKFKAKEGPGVKFAQAVVGKDAAKLETQRMTMRVPFVPDGAGQRTVSGRLLFSVCTDETCLLEKRDLSLVVDVK